MRPVSNPEAVYGQLVTKEKLFFSNGVSLDIPHLSESLWLTQNKLSGIFKIFFFVSILFGHFLPYWSFAYIL